jgi:hypothetical protein
MVEGMCLVKLVSWKEVMGIITNENGAAAAHVRLEASSVATRAWKITIVLAVVWRSESRREEKRGEKEDDSMEAQTR